MLTPVKKLNVQFCWFLDVTEALTSCHGVAMLKNIRVPSSAIFTLRCFKKFDSFKRKKFVPTPSLLPNWATKVLHYLLLQM